MGVVNEEAYSDDDSSDDNEELVCTTIQQFNAE